MVFFYVNVICIYFEVVILISKGDVNMVEVLGGEFVDFIWF